MTRFQFNCRKGVLLLLAFLLAALCALFTPAHAQSVQAMVQRQPFPYPSGVAMDTVLYKTVKAKLLAADSLRSSAQRHIKTLQAEIQLTRKAKDDLFRLQTYDAGRADSLTRQMNVLQGDLIEINALLTEAESAIDGVIRTLPRRIQKQLNPEEPEQIARATAEYVTLLQWRKWKWAGAAAGISFILSLIAF